MASSNHKRHLFHIVEPSPWPLFSALGAFFLLSGFAFYMHRIQFGGLFWSLGLLILIFTAFFWFNDIIEESTFQGHHTLVVRAGIRFGFLLFVVSEVMLFFGFFWAYFHASLSPALEIGVKWPPTGIQTISTWGFPFFNTFLLIISGVAITWAHRAMAVGLFREAIDSFLITIFLGFFFVILQMFEYYEASFNISDSVYSSAFFMLTGLHGMHVVVGASFILICFFRLLNRHFTRNHYLGFVFAIWYWHFVDAVWIFLFICVYWWGSW